MPLKEFVVDVSRDAAPQQRTPSLSKLFYLNSLFRGPLSAVWLLVMPAVLPEMTPARTERAGMCGAGRSCQPELPNRRLKQDPRDAWSSAALREEKTVRLRGIHDLASPGK